MNILNRRDKKDKMEFNVLLISMFEYSLMYTTGPNRWFFPVLLFLLFISISPQMKLNISNCSHSVMKRLCCTVSLLNQCATHKFTKRFISLTFPGAPLSVWIFFYPPEAKILLSLSFLPVIYIFTKISKMRIFFLHMIHSWVWFKSQLFKF